MDVFAGLCRLPSTSFICNNLQSAIREPEVVDRLLSREIDEGYMIGPFDDVHFPSPPMFFSHSLRLIQRHGNLFQGLKMALIHSAFVVVLLALSAAGAFLTFEQVLFDVLFYVLFNETCLLCSRSFSFGCLG